MKICLVAVNASYSHSSLSVRCLQKALELDSSSVFEFTINDTYEHVLSRLYEHDAEVYAFSCYIWNIEYILKISELLKKANSKCRILLGGAEVSYDAEAVLRNNDFVDYVLCGEGEISLKKFVCGEDFDKIEGLCYRKISDGAEVVLKNEPKMICELDKLPRLYSENELLKLENKIVYYETSRGCPFSCSFCLSSTIHGVRFFSLKRVFEDFAMFARCGVKLVKLVDRTFNTDERRTNEILRFILENTGDTCFHFEISAHILRSSTIELLKAMPKGKVQLEIGVQSTNDKTIEAINRKTDFEKLKKNVFELSQNKNMHIHLDLIAGLPYEDILSFKKSFNDVFEMRPDMLQLGFLKLLKGSEIRNNAKAYGYVFSPYPPYEVISNKYILFSDVLLLKGVCMIVEKYYNSGAFKNSLEYALEKFGDAFEFFRDFYIFFKNSGYEERSCSRRMLYDIFFEFYGSDALFGELLLFDYYKNNKGAPAPAWAKMCGNKEFLKKTSEYISSNREILNENLRYEKLSDILKSVRIYPFSHRVLSDRKEGRTAVLFDYLNGVELEINMEEFENEKTDR